MARYLSDTFTMNSTSLTHAMDAGLHWLLRTFEVTGRQGSAHSYHLAWGWRKAYPETTGYIIETLFDQATLRHSIPIRQLAFDSLDWLLTQQLPEGAFPGLLTGATHPSLFNTSQILFGLTRGVEEHPDARAREQLQTALRQAVDWMISMLETDGSWQQAAFHPGFTPSYYTRSVWGVLRANVVLQNETLTAEMRTALQFYCNRMLPNGAIADWGFKPGAAAYTHTIAYTYRGFLESALLLRDQTLLHKLLDALNGFLEQHKRNGNRTAGRYDTRWRGDYSFKCLTGQAQLSVVFQRAFEITGNQEYRNAARTLFQEMLPYQNRSRNPDLYGGFPGSAPVWGPYLRFSYPNWGAKFFLDAGVGVLSFEL